MALIILFTSLVAIGIVVAVVRGSRRWAIALQQYYVREAQRRGSDSSRWEKPWIRTLFRTGIIFSSLVVIAIVLVLFFGPI
jgi:ABC-type Fe3+ transport system permease subunit